MKPLKHLLLLVLAAVSLASCSETEEHTVYATPLRTVITGMEYGDSVLVVGHKSPDSDATFSAMAYAALLQRLGINAKARVAGKVICEPRYVLQAAGIPAPPVLTDATGLNVVMTDHSEFAQAVDGMAQANILHVIDHHGTGSVTTAHPLFYYALPLGSTCTIVATMYEELGEQPTAAEARLLLSGLLSDTDSLTSATTTPTDRRLFAQLLAQSGISDIGAYYAEMRRARTSFDGMTDEEILLSDFKEYDIEGLRVGIGSVFASERLGVEELCQRMRAVMDGVRTAKGLDMVFMMLGDRQADVTHVPFCGDGARQVAELAFGASATPDDCIVTRYISSRKAQFLPAITEGISKWKNI
ncbi:MAG: DHH family phosphoesterase [Bacteroidaceae bacterium]|nr:DHH family phosphoesterase [Bacteroidaceae bacterium]